ncbi:MAG: hypothetical protein ACI38R_22675 [Rhodococcus sp. (in: high G+C Gram-positive bacteria)]
MTDAALTREQLGAAHTVLGILPRLLHPREGLAREQTEIDCARARRHVRAGLLATRSVRPQRTPKLQVRKRFNTVAGQDTWCLIEPNFPNWPPMWPPAHWGWRETFDLALRLAKQERLANEGGEA